MYFSYFKVLHAKCSVVLVLYVEQNVNCEQKTVLQSGWNGLIKLLLEYFKIDSPAFESISQLSFQHLGNFENQNSKLVLKPATI